MKNLLVIASIFTSSLGLASTLTAPDPTPIKGDVIPSTAYSITIDIGSAKSVGVTIRDSTKKVLVTDTLKH